jgi:hypothetical protein
MFVKHHKQKEINLIPLFFLVSLFWCVFAKILAQKKKKKSSLVKTITRKRKQKKKK